MGKDIFTTVYTESNIIFLLITAIQIYFDYRVNTMPNGENNSSIRPEINHSQFPLSLTNFLFIEEIKYSLKHDSVF